ncbi:hypothetical protein PoB_000084700 [Plakobranchus ocellatus]|uniref:CARD domain-containing protein n=1 Tax=Plakobranchus ocellatus TaxID=259542 RepID=A0AAV3XV16_9GAST|nr:hypothetical protein PoB_000084700 [Plakobranchus ocellatus]
MADRTPVQRSLRRGSSVSSILEPGDTTEAPVSAGGSDPGQGRRWSRPGTSKNRQSDIADIGADKKSTDIHDSNNKNNENGGDDGINSNNKNDYDNSNNNNNSNTIRSSNNNEINREVDWSIPDSVHPSQETAQASLPAQLDLTTSREHNGQQSTLHQDNDFKLTEAVHGAPSISSQASTHHYLQRGSNALKPNHDFLKPKGISKGRNKFSSRLGSRRADPSRLSVMSKTSSYYHGDVVDENLLLSAARIDSTLLRLFSRSRDGEQTRKALESEDKLLPFLNYSESDLISMDAVLWRVHPMEAVHKEALEQEMSFLEEHVRPGELLRKLYMHEVLTHMDYNTIVRTEGQGERAVTRLLMKTLMRRGDKAYSSLISALRTLQYHHVCDRLQKAERELRRAMEEEKRESRFSLHTHKHLGLSTVSSRNFYHPGGVTNSALSPHLLSSSFDDHHHHPHPQQIVQDDSYTKPVDGSVEVSADHGVPPTGPIQKTALLTGRSAVLDARKLEEQLSGLDAELKALHEDVTALKTARSHSLVTGRVASNQHSDQAQGEQRVQKSGSCTIL